MRSQRSAFASLVYMIISQNLNLLSQHPRNANYCIELLPVTAPRAHLLHTLLKLQYIIHIEQNNARATVNECIRLYNNKSLLSAPSMLGDSHKKLLYAYKMSPRASTHYAMHTRIRSIFTAESSFNPGARVRRRALIWIICYRRWITLADRRR